MKKICIFVVLGLIAVGTALWAAPADTLANDLNAIVPASAAVKGATVALSKKVALAGALTVPEGVTLDITKGQLELKNGAALTVNGLILANGSVEVDGITDYSISVTGASVAINGKGIIRSAGEGNLLRIISGRKLTLTDVKLDGLSSSKNANWPSWVSVDSKDNSVPLVWVGGKNASLVMAGEAIIAGNTCTWRGGVAESGGGVLVIDSGYFEMGGNSAVAGNTQLNNRYGGGVHVSGSQDQSTPPAIFVMKGNAAVWGNSCLPMDNASSRGGGVALDNTTTFTMQGNAKIYGNQANIGGGLYTQGLYCNFNFEGGTIYGANERDAKLRNNADVPKRGSSLHISTSGDASKILWGKSGVFTGGDGTKAPGSPILTGSTGAVFENGAVKLGNNNILTQDTLIAK
jgi:hypothetical protein